MSSQISLDAYKRSIADLYNQRSDHYDQGDYHSRLARLLLDSVGIEPGQRVLDVATGTGIVALQAAERVGADGYVMGVDFADQMLGQARRKAESMGLKNVKFLQADVETVELPHASFDVVLCSAAIIWFTDLPATLRRWHHVLKPGGKLGFNAWTETSFIYGVVLQKIAPKYGISLPNWHGATGTPERCRTLLEGVGFEGIEIRTDQLGSYVSLEQLKARWEGFMNLPMSKGVTFPFGQLSPEQLEQAKLDYWCELEALATARGVWDDILTLTVIGRKRG